MDDQLLNAKVKELRQYKRMLEEVQQNISSIEAQIKEELSLRKTDQIITDEYKITFKPVISIRLDSKALKAERPEIFARYAKEIQARRFLVT